MSQVKFQTEINLPEFPAKTGYRKKNLFMGSCFTENIGNKMAALCYDVDVNPFGILYNPVSVANGLEFLLEEKKLKKSDLIQHDNLWHSFYHHGRFSSPDAAETVKKINKRIDTSSEFLKKTDFLFITFGTAWIYNYIETGQTVSNCHKIPGNKFRRNRLSVNEIVDRYAKLLRKLHVLNPEINIIFTVSPIRHWKDGAVENQRSKATLVLAVSEIISNTKQINCSYFPSYELVMDELRDYRFYANDMIHLSDVAINYIWEKFETKLIDTESQDIAKKVKKIAAAINHKPFNKFTPEHLNFLNQTLKRAEQLSKTYGFLNLETEQNYLRDQVKEIEKNEKIN